MGVDVKREGLSSTFSLMLYPDEDADKMIDFWKREIGAESIAVIRKESSGTRRYTNHGTLRYRVSDWRLFHKIMTWIECARKE